MKRVLKILIVVLLFAGINVYAENKIVYNNDSYFFANENDLRIGNWIPNNTYIFQSVTTSYNYATQQTTVIEMQNHYYRFYDENNNLIKETQPNLVDLPDGSNKLFQIYQVKNDSSSLWEITNIERDGLNTTISFKIVPLEENQVIRCYTPNVENNSTFYNGIANKGDIVIFNTNGGYISYSEDYFGYDENYYFYQTDYYNGRYSSFKVGYKVDNQSEEIDTDITKFWIYYAGGSCNGTVIVFYERIDPTFRIECESNTIKPNSSTKCSLIMNTLYLYPHLNITIPKRNDYTIENIKEENEEYQIEEDNNKIILTSLNFLDLYEEQYQQFLEWQEHYSEYDEDFYFYDSFDYYMLDEETEYVLFSFTIRANETVEKQDELNSLFNVGFQMLNYDEDVNLEKVFVVEKLKNPETLTNSWILILICFAIVMGFAYFHKNNKLKEI